MRYGISGNQAGWRRAVAFIAMGCLVANLRAGGVPWEFNPQRVGLALPEGGWMVQRNLDSLSLAPEFSFPLQLVYLSSRLERSSLGDQWFCPQIESSVIPKGQGVLAWTMPSGNVIGLFAQKNRPTEFQERSGEWHARLAGTQLTITSGENWQLIYRSGHLEQIQAPSGRALDYAYEGNRLVKIYFRDTGTTRDLVTLTRQADGRVTDLKVFDRTHHLGYENGRDGRLVSWQQAGAAKADAFSYGPSGVLAAIQPGSGPKVEFKTEFVPPGKNPPEDAKQKPGNYWLIDDGEFKYRYGKGKDHWIADQITTEDRMGGRRSYSAATSRGLETSVGSDGQEQKTYYYRAPGQKFDGKLRRVEQGGVVVVDNLYDKATGRLTESRDQNGTITFYEYAPTPKGMENDPQFAKPVRILRGTRKTAEVIATLKYDKAGRLLERTDAANQMTRVTYNARGEVETITEPSGLKSTLTYDSFGHVAGIEKGGVKEAAEYDQQGHVKSRKMPDGQLAEFTYDAQGQQATIKQNGILVASFERDEHGLVAAKLDALHRKTQFEHDARGNLTAEIQPNGDTTRYEYDSQGHRTAQIDGQKNRIEFAYDSAGHLARQTNPLGQILTWSYEKGMLTARTNGVQRIGYSYDPKGRLSRIDYGKGEEVAYEYDEQGRASKVKTPTVATTLFYDSANRVLAKQSTRGGIDRVMRYSYDQRGAKASVTLSEKNGTAAAGPDSSTAAYQLLQQTEYSYDAAGDLVELKSNGQVVCHYRYDSTGRLTGRTYGNGIEAKYGYDKFGRETSMALSGGPLASPLLLTYDWDEAGQLKSRTWNGETQIYGYDPSGQLRTVSATTAAGEGMQPVANVSASAPVAATLIESYTYDHAGNMLEKTEGNLKTTMSYDAGNQLKASAAQGINTDFTYDAAGRLVSSACHPEPAEGPRSSTRSYGYLDKVTSLTKGEGNQIGFDYYPDGQLAAKTNPATKDSPPLSSLVWDGLALVYRDGERFAVEPHVSGGVPVTGSRGLQGPMTYYVNDILGTTLAVITPSGVQVAPMTAFGRPLKTANAAPPTGNLPTTTLSPENGSPVKNKNN